MLIVIYASSTFTQLSTYAFRAAYPRHKYLANLIKYNIILHTRIEELID